MLVEGKQSRDWTLALFTAARWDAGGDDVEVNRDKSSLKTLIVFALFARDKFPAPPPHQHPSRSSPS